MSEQNDVSCAECQTENCAARDTSDKYGCGEGKPKVSLPLTQAQYAKGEKGAKCPFCFSSNIKGGNVAIHLGEAHQTIRCKDCKQEWLDFYELVAYQPTMEV